MAVKMNLRIITKWFAADPGIGFLTKSISKANGYGTAMPPAWELKSEFSVDSIFDKIGPQERLCCAECVKVTIVT